MAKKKKNEVEFDLYGLRMSVRVKGGSYIDLDLDRDTEKMFFGVVGNFFKSDLPFNKEQLEEFIKSIQS